MFKMVRKGKNPGAVDNWLDSLGLYRKNVAYDETCLFRAASEQLFDCQIHHERVRKECIAYGRKHHEHFVHLRDSKRDWLDHLDRLEKHMVVCGNIELHIISRKYGRDIVIFNAAQQKIVDVVNHGRSKSLLLCLLDEDHYDVVYKKEHISNTGFCQSIVYKVLYENVFNISNVDEIVNTMLYDKTGMVTTGELAFPMKVEDDSCGSTSKEEDPNTKQPLSNAVAPFPFKVAKALDPTIYRNIEYDSWGEVRREMRLGEWYYGDNRLILGTKCIYNDDNYEKHECYIQEIIKDENKCVIYLMNSAQKKTVNYSDLSPEDDAKPWPLPYRFSKNLNISVPTPTTDFKISLKPRKRCKDKKRTKSESSILSGPLSGATPEHIDNVNAFVGVPLQMQNVNKEAASTNGTTEVSTEIHADVSAPKQQILLPETPSTPNKYPYEASQWYHYLPPTPDSYIWSQPATSPNLYNYKPMIASAPVTPDVVPYHDSNYPYYYNYHMDPVTYQSYSQWSSAGMEMHHSTPIADKADDIKCQASFSNSTQLENVYTEANTLQYQTEYVQACEKIEPVYEPVTTVTVTRPKERPTLMTNLTASTPTEMYSPIIPVPPGTPVVFTTAPAPEITEVVLPNTPILYTPTVDVQYVSPGPYIYPPTPPSAWYPAGVTSQGFIFPTRN